MSTPPRLEEGGKKPPPHPPSSRFSLFLAQLWPSPAQCFSPVGSVAMSQAPGLLGALQPTAFPAWEVEADESPRRLGQQRPPVDGAQVGGAQVKLHGEQRRPRLCAVCGEAPQCPPQSTAHPLPFGICGQLPLPRPWAGA